MRKANDFYETINYSVLKNTNTLTHLKKRSEFKTRFFC